MDISAGSRPAGPWNARLDREFGREAPIPLHKLVAI